MSFQVQFFKYPDGGLDFVPNTIKDSICLGGGIGRHAGLKILCFHERTGSSPVPGTKAGLFNKILRSPVFLFLPSLLIIPGYS
jgi:hypothetical protein